MQEYFLTRFVDIARQRIVARVEALFALCDGLAAGLAEGEAVRGRWVAAVLAGV